MTQRALATLLVAFVAACAGPRPAQRPPPVATTIAASAVPADALDVDRALQAPDQQPVRLTAWLLAPSYDCPPCPQGAACEPCRSPYPEFARQGASTPAFHAIVELDLTQADVGQQFLLEGRWSGEQNGLRMLVAQRIQRIVR